MIDYVSLVIYSDVSPVSKIYRVSYPNIQGSGGKVKIIQFICGEAFAFRPDLCPISLAKHCESATQE